MATYHCNIKVGKCGKTIPHFGYIMRKGKYEERKDLQYAESGNMPEWAETPEDFWRACAANERERAYREIEFAIPNELEREEQIELVQEYIKEIIPENAYSYAIHEVDSAIHGQKNTHVHLMFSERIMDEAALLMDKETFFKKHGRSKSGIEYGGSIKDRSWSGRGKYTGTEKFIDVRQKLADKINKYYEKNNLPYKISADTLENQNKKIIYSGNIEKRKPYTDRIVRIDETTFRSYLPVIRSEIHKDNPIENIENEAIVQRIYQDRERMLYKNIQKAVDDHNAKLIPTEKEQYEALIFANKEFENLRKFYNSPFKTVKNKFKPSTDEHYDPLSPDYRVLVACINQSETMEKEFVADLITEKITQIIPEERLFKYRETSPDKYLLTFLNEKSKGTYNAIHQKIRSKQNLLKYLETKNQPEEVMKLQEEINFLQKEKRTIYQSTMTPEGQKELEDIKRCLLSPIEKIDDMLERRNKLFSQKDDLEKKIAELRNINTKKLSIKLINSRFNNYFEEKKQEIDRKEFNLDRLKIKAGRMPSKEQQKVISFLEKDIQDKKTNYIKELQAAINDPENKEYIKKYINSIRQELKEAKVTLAFVNQSIDKATSPQEKTVADLIFNREQLESKIKSYKFIRDEDLTTNLLNQKTNGLYREILQTIESKKTLLKFVSKDPEKKAALYEELTALREEKEFIIYEHLTADDKKTINAAKVELNKKIDSTEKAIDKLKEIEKIAAKELPVERWQRVRERVTQIKKIQQKHDAWQKQIKKKDSERMENIQEALDFYNNADKPLDYFLNRAINEETDGELDKLKVKINEKREKIQTERAAKRPVEHLYKELDQLNTKARELRLKYLPIAREKATKMKEKFKTNKGKYPFKKLSSTYHRIANRTRIPDKLKNAFEEANRGTSASRVDIKDASKIENMNEL